MTSDFEPVVDSRVEALDASHGHVARIVVRDGLVGAGRVGALAFGALAVGAFAIGAVAIGRLVVRSLTLGRGFSRSLKNSYLSGGDLRVGRLTRLDAPEK